MPDHYTKVRMLVQRLERLIDDVDEFLDEPEPPDTRELVELDTMIDDANYEIHQCIVNIVGVDKATKV